MTQEDTKKLKSLEDKPRFLKSLEDKPRFLLEVNLKPLQGDRFQPTGFPDLGAATYDAPDGTKMLLVESVQSMANRMELVCWDAAKNELVEPLKGLCYVEVEDENGEKFTNSILEAHRIGSTYLLKAEKSTIDEIFKNEFNKKSEKKNKESNKLKPYSTKDLAKLLFEYDIGSLLHGVFLPLYGGGRCRITRALSAFIEAKNVKVVDSGGVKIDIINPGQRSSNDEGKKASEEGYGNIIYPRREYTAEKITAFFNLDLALIRSYELGKDQEDLLIALAIFKIRKFIDSNLRLRTACDLKAEGTEIKEPTGFELPTYNEILEVLPDLISKCKKEDHSPFLTGKYIKERNVKKEDSSSEDDEDSSSEDKNE